MNSERIICRWCNKGEVLRKSYGAKARWIVENPRSEVLTELVECPVCKLVYFTVDFSEVELQRMYDGYRGGAYLKRRHRYEPWYTKRVNQAIGHSPIVLEHRRRHLRSLISDAVDRGVARSPSRVLDVGGDEGQFIPDIESITTKAVLEVSGVRPIEGVGNLGSWREVEAFQPDLIMMCHVLEHTSGARDMVLSSAVALSEGGLLYLEVPLDRPSRLPRVMSHRRYAAYTRCLARHPALFMFADGLSLLSKRILGRPIIGSATKQNEHINFFDEASLSQVLENLGFQKVVESVYKPSSGVPILDVSALGVLYRRT